MSGGYTNSSIANQLDIDPRNPIGNNLGPNSVLVKDATRPLRSASSTDRLPAQQRPALVAPPTPTAPSTAGHTIASDRHLGVRLRHGCTAGAEAAIIAGAFGPGYTASQGDPVNLKGNQMPNTPPWTVSFGAQYTFNMDGGYTLIPRADYYWTAAQWARIFEDGADRVRSYDVVNAQLMLNSPNNFWYARAWVKNIFDKDNMTGEYLTDASSGLFTNAFVGEPRTFGITVGTHF